jgi:hypothetical protein
LCGFAAVAPIRSRNFLLSTGTELLKDFLITPLDGTFPLAEVEHVAVQVSHNLKFDVARARQIFFNVQRAIAESGGSLFACNRKYGLNSAGVLAIRNPRPPPPAAALTRIG